LLLLKNPEECVHTTQMPSLPANVNGGITSEQKKMKPKNDLFAYGELDYLSEN